MSRLVRWGKGKGEPLPASTLLCRLPSCGRPTRTTPVCVLSVLAWCLLLLLATPSLLYRPTPPPRFHRLVAFGAVFRLASDSTSLSDFSARHVGAKQVRRNTIDSNPVLQVWYGTARNRQHAPGTPLEAASPPHRRVRGRRGTLPVVRVPWCRLPSAASWAVGCWLLLSVGGAGGSLARRTRAASSARCFCRSLGTGLLLAHPLHPIPP